MLLARCSFGRVGSKQYRLVLRNGKVSTLGLETLMGGGGEAHRRCSNVVRYGKGKGNRRKGKGRSRRGFLSTKLLGWVMVWYRTVPYRAYSDSKIIF